MTNRRTVLRCSAAVALGATALSAFISGADLFSWVRWERFTVVDEPNLQYLQKVKAGIDPVHYLGPLGAPGLTGYAGITQVAKPKGVIAAQRVECGVPHVVSCRALGVSQAWLYKWRRGDPSLRRKRRAALAAVIAYLFKAHHGGYGSPGITADLREMGWVVSKNTVAGLMAEQGLLARRKRRRRSSTRSDRRARKAPDALRRDFTSPQRPNARWCGDLTEVPTDEGKLHLSAILDLHSRRCVGFAMGAHHDAELARAALCTAIAIRGGSVKGMLFHSDQGGEYTSELFARACRNAAVTQSMGVPARPSITLSRRTCGPPSRSSWCIATAGAPATRPRPRCSATSMGGTTRTASKPVSAGCRPTSTRPPTTPSSKTQLARLPCQSRLAPDNKPSGKTGEAHRNSHTRKIKCPSLRGPLALAVP